MLSWVRDNLKDLKPKDFYKELGYSHTSRKQAEEKLRELLAAIKNENNIINRKKATCLLDSFEINDEEEALNEFQPPSNDKSKPQTPENKIIKDPKNNPFFIRSNDSDGSWRPECEDEEDKLAEQLRHAESTIRAVNESAEDVRSVSSSETKLLLKRKRQDDVNCFDKGADKRNRCKIPKNKIRTTNGTVVEESSSNFLMNISETSLTQLSHAESKVVNEEIGSEIKSIDDELSLNSPMNVSSETTLTQLSYNESQMVNEKTDSETKSIDDGLSPNSLTSVSSETSLSYTESQVLNEETDSEIKSIDDEISPKSLTNVSSETLSQKSYTNTTEVDSSLESAKEVGDKSKQKSKYINRDIASEALKAYQMDVLAGKKLIYEGLDVLDSARSNMNMKSKIAKSPICIGVINIHNPDCTKFLPDNFKYFIANQLQNCEARDIQFTNERKIDNFTVDCEEEVLHFLEKFDHVDNLKSLGECLDENPINHSTATNDLIYVQNLFNHFFFLYKNDILLQSISESEFNAYVWTPLLKNAFLGKDDLKLSCGELASNSYEKLKEILDIGGRSAPKLDGKGLLKALGTEILVQEDGVLNTRGVDFSATTN
ncbi:hypothetical protein RhiirA4_501293 [Rhizophagus irregularis]|uniref:Uncharacterized protein n=1 Tax=Rhizophagus irregularis TaxID=588596 RepID=A0A2I1H660_9GLOM|nr:hypothetical protein RhiirA4_501293 [Rhizophagus irregularis]